MTTRPGSRIAAAEIVRRLAYLHVPKAAGTALTSAIEKNLGQGSLSPVRFDRAVFGPFDQFDELAPAIRAAVATNEAELEALREARFVAGHFFLSSLARFFELGEIFTVLREPRARLLSQYDFWRLQTPEENALWAPYDLPAAAQQAFARFLEDPKAASSTDNVVCRLVLGPDERFSAERFIDPADAAALADEAIGRLRELRYVAVVEAEAPGFAGLREALGLTQDVGEENVGRGGGRTPVDSHLDSLLKRRTIVDTEIYRAFAAPVFGGEAAANAAAETAFRVRFGL